MNLEKETAMLMLIFADDTAQYRDRVLPTGSIACMAMNTPREALEESLPLCRRIASVNAMLRTLSGDKTAMSSACMAAHNLLKLISKYEPFTFLNNPKLDQRLDEVFSMEAFKKYGAYNNAVVNGQMNQEAEQKFGATRDLVLLAPALASYYDAVTSLQERVAPFAESLDEQGKDRTKEKYLAQFRTSFPEDFQLGDEKDSWMSMTNVSVQYAAGMAADGKRLQMKKHMHFISIGSMLRADFFEGLSVGHAPKRCAICGRWFLTTDARHTKYCGEICPTDPMGRKCRAIGNLRGREARERADDHPLNKIYQRRMNTIDQCLKRETLSSDVARMMKKLAKDKHQRAISDLNYVKGNYEAEMAQGALKAEALRALK